MIRFTIHITMHEIVNIFKIYCIKREREKHLCIKLGIFNIILWKKHIPMYNIMIPRSNVISYWMKKNIGIPEKIEEIIVNIETELNNLSVVENCTAIQYYSISKTITIISKNIFLGLSWFSGKSKASKLFSLQVIMTTLK